MSNLYSLHRLAGGCATLLLVACSSTVVQPDGDGDGGSGPGGAGSGAAGTGGAGGEAPLLPCTRLAAIDPGSVKLGDGAYSLAMVGASGHLAALHQAPSGSVRYAIGAWTAWPPTIENVGHLDFPYANLYVSRSAGVGTTVLASYYQEPEISDLFVDLTPGQASPAPVPVSGSTAFGLTTTASGYVAALQTSDHHLQVVGLDAGGNQRWLHAIEGCTIGQGIRGRPQFLVEAEATDSTRLAFTIGAGLNGSCLGSGTISLLSLALDAAGEGTPTLIESRDDWAPQALGLLPGDGGGTRLVYGNFDETLDGFNVQHPAGYGELWQVRLDASGAPIATATPLGLTGRTAESASVAVVEGGFVVARFVRDEQAAAPTNQVALALFDEAGNLLQEILTDETAPADYIGVRSVAAPDGRSVVLGWTRINDVTSTSGKSESRLMRFDCVEP